MTSSASPPRWALAQILSFSLPAWARQPAIRSRLSSKTPQILNSLSACRTSLTLTLAASFPDQSLSNRLVMKFLSLLFRSPVEPPAPRRKSWDRTISFPGNGAYLYEPGFPPVRRLSPRRQECRRHRRRTRHWAGNRSALCVSRRIDSHHGQQR